MKIIIITILVLLVVCVCVVNIMNNSEKDDILKILVRQSARWSNAAVQDKSPLVAVLHANYGAGYLWAIRDIASDQEVYDATGIDIHEFMAKILAVQDTATKKMASVCPEYAKHLDKELSKIGGEI